jgi:F-type H+-transporting ATPase subunit delta
VELRSDDVERLKQLLQKVTGKTVILEQKVDPALIGGLVTRVGGLVFDGSLRTQLANMRQRLVQQTA